MLYNHIVIGKKIGPASAGPFLLEMKMNENDRLSRLALEVAQDFVDEWQTCGLPVDILTDALTKHAEHLRSGSTTPLVKMTDYLENKRR